MKFDYLVVGAGLFGSVCARELTNAGKKCLVIDRREHIGGNCFTKNIDNINVHVYGPHIFHTNSKKVWDYINRWISFNNYTHTVFAVNQNEIFSLPINLFTMHQLWGVVTPNQAKKKIQEVQIHIENPTNLEEWALSQIGEELYYKLIYGYTKKQWGKDPKELPISIIKRLPIRFDMDTRYFSDLFQGIPMGGYTKIFENLLHDIPVECNIDFIKNKDRLESSAGKVIFSGSIDELFGCDLGELGWRGLTFEHSQIDIDDYQGNAQINYTNENVPYTRITEHKHFEFSKGKSSVITKEFPQSNEKYYPITDDVNTSLYQKYRERLSRNYIIGGRLAEYQYYNMDQVIASALGKVEKELA